MKTNINGFIILIKNIKTIELANLAGVGRNMAEKYKNSSSLPPLDKAILFEDKFNIPPRAWVDIKKFKDAQK